MKLLILGYYTIMDKSYLNFKTSLDKFGYKNYKLITANQIDTTIQHINEDLILFLNANESILATGEQELMKMFLSFNTPLVFGAQSLNEGIELKKWWYHKHCQHRRQNLNKPLHMREDLRIPVNKYVNLNNYIGYTGIIKELIQMTSIDYFIELNPEKCSLDISSQLFGNITINSDDLLFYNKIQDRIQDQRSLQNPCVIIFPNSRSDLHLRMYKFSKCVLGEVAHYNLDFQGFFMILLKVFPLVFINRLSLKYIVMLLGIFIYFIRYIMCLYL